MGLGGGRLIRLRQLLGDGIGELGKLPINTQLEVLERRHARLRTRLAAALPGCVSLPAIGGTHEADVGRARAAGCDGGDRRGREDGSDGDGRDADAPPEEERSPWQFEVAPYLWISGTAGTLDVHGRSTSFDIGPGNLIDLLFEGNALAGAGFFSARYERLFGFVDAFGAYVKDSVDAKVPTRFCCVSVTAEQRARPVIIDVGVGYQLGEWTLPKRLRPVSLGAYVGMRYSHFGIDLAAGAGAGNFQRQVAASDEFNWADPLIGLRGEYPGVRSAVARVPRRRRWVRRQLGPHLGR